MSVEFLDWFGSLEPVCVSGSLLSSSVSCGLQSLQTETVAPAISISSSDTSVAPQSWHESSAVELELPVEYFAIYSILNSIYLKVCFVFWSIGVVGWLVVLTIFKCFLYYGNSFVCCCC